MTLTPFVYSVSITGDKLNATSVVAQRIAREFSKARWIAWAFLFIVISAYAMDAPKRVFEERPHEVINTELQFMSGIDPFGPRNSFHLNWISNNSFIVTAAQDQSNANAAQAERTMLVDTRNGKSVQIVEPGWILWCFNQSRGVGSIRPSPFKPIQPYKPTQDYVQYRFIPINAEGQVGPPLDVHDMNPVTCQTAGMGPQSVSFVQSLHENDGYIRRNLHGNHDTVEWIRPDAPPITLRVWPSEFNGMHGNRGNFLEHVKKYLLNSGDSQGNSATDKRLGGAFWHRPYDLTPYRLLSLDGTIEEIPYPKIIFDYGLKGFGHLLPTPAGLLISTDNSLVLISGDTLTRIWGKPSLGFIGGDEYPWGMQLSPDGCKVAFVRVTDWKPETNKPISIIKLCEGE